MRVDLENRCQSLSEDLEFRKGMFEEVSVCGWFSVSFVHYYSYRNGCVSARLETNLLCTISAPPPCAGGA